MKKLLTRILLMAVLLGVGFTDTAQAQYRTRPSRPHHHYHNSGDGVYRAIRAVEDIGHMALFGRMLHGLDDYTGFRFGYNAASLRTDLRYSDVNSDFTSGLNLGFVFGWHLGRTPLIIEPGIFYSMKGGDLKGNYLADGMAHNLTRFTNKVTMHNFEIPLVLKCQLPISPDNYVNLQPFFGGFLSFGFAGDTKFEDALGRDKYGTYSDDLFCTTDAGLRMGLGMNVGMFYLEAAYDLGLVNLPENGYSLMDFDDFSDSMRSNTISFNVGFNF